MRDDGSPAVPTPQQSAGQRERAFALSCHVGVNTFYGREWSDGTLDPAAFDPHTLDCRQWVAVAKDAGAAHIILTAKLHDGFCLWPTESTDYSVCSASWRNGEGDVVTELADASRENGIGLVLHLSPWDRHDPDREASPEVYDARSIVQLTKLSTRYVWFVERWVNAHDAEQVRRFAVSIRKRFADPPHAALSREGMRIEVTFPEPVPLNHLVLRETIANGQRIGWHQVLDGHDGHEVVNGVFTIGSQRAHAFSRVETDRPVIGSDNPSGALIALQAHLTGVEAIPVLEAQPGKLAGKMDGHV